MAGYGFAAYDPARGLRDLGNGANDTSGSYGIVLNAMPDPVVLRDALSSKDPLYPKMDKNDDKYQLATKGLMAFSDTRWNHQSASPFRSDLDIVYYVDNFAGLYSKSDSLISIVSNLAYVGFVDNDVLPNENSSKDNTLSWSAKKTFRNTGNKRILAGNLIFWDLKPSDPSVKGGAAGMADMAANYCPMWTLPYDESIHRGCPQLIYAALTDPRYNVANTVDSGLKDYAEKWIEAVKNAAVVLAVASGSAQNGAVATAINGMTSNRVAELLLNPASNLLFNKALPPIGALQITAPSTVDNSGTIFPSNTDLFAAKLKASLALNNVPPPTGGFVLVDQQLSTEQQVNLKQLSAAEDLFFFNNKINGFYTNRVVGQAIVSSDPSKDGEMIPVRVLCTS